MGDAQVLPGRTVARADLAQMGEQAVAELAHGHARFPGQGAQERRLRRVADQVDGRPHRDQGWVPGQKADGGQGVFLPGGQPEALGERQLPVPVLQMGNQLRQLATKHHVVGLAVPLQTGPMSPASQPLEQLQPPQEERGLGRRPLAVLLGQPLDESPIRRGEQLLFVDGAGGEFDEFGQRARLLARARAEEGEVQGQVVEAGLLGQRHQAGDHPQVSPRGIQMGGGGGQEPMLQVAEPLLLGLGLLDFGQAAEVGVAGQLGGQRAAGAQEEQRGLF